MAREFKILSVVLLLVACLANLSTSAPADPTTTNEPDATVATGPPTTNEPVATVATGPPTTNEPAPTVATGPPTTNEPAPTVATDPTTTNEPVPTVATDPTTTNEPVPTVTSDPTTTNETVTGTPGQNITTEAALTTTEGPTKIPDPCDPNPCGDGSTCQPRADQNYECFCLTGEKYNNQTQTCELARVFPGQLSLTKMKYHEDMTNTTSQEFLQASEKITAVLDKAYKPLGGYSGSLVLKLTKGTPLKKVWWRAEAGINAEIEITFEKDSTVSLQEVKTTMKDDVVCTGCGLEGEFKEEDLCAKGTACDKKSTVCMSGEGNFNCTCLKTHIPTDYSDRVCIACASGKKAVDKVCVDCPFGRSGFDCQESWELVLVIVGSVLGGLLLITIILLPIVARKSSKKGSKKEKKDKKADTGNAYVSQPAPKKPLAESSFANSQAAPANGQANSLSAFANAGVPRIPRASANSWDRRTNLEMTPSNSRQNLISTGRRFDDHEDMNRFGQARPQSSLYAQARPQSNPYAQTRPQSNPYAQTRPQTNPYAQSHGNSNPYYMHDDDRRLN